MIEERFSSERFEALGLDTPEAAELVKGLEKALVLAMDGAVKQAFGKIAEKLNAMGHQLQIYDDAPGTLTFREDWEDEDGYHCKLRIAFDSVISAGYADLWKPDEPELDLDEAWDDDSS